MTSTAMINPIGPIPHPAPIPQYRPPPPPNKSKRTMIMSMVSIAILVEYFAATDDFSSGDCACSTVNPTMVKADVGA